MHLRRQNAISKQIALAYHPHVTVEVAVPYICRSGVTNIGNSVWRGSTGLILNRLQQTAAATLAGDNPLLSRGAFFQPLPHSCT